MPALNPSRRLLEDVTRPGKHLQQVGPDLVRDCRIVEGLQRLGTRSERRPKNALLLSSSNESPIAGTASSRSQGIDSCSSVSQATDTMRVYGSISSRAARFDAGRPGIVAITESTGRAAMHAVASTSST